MRDRSHARASATRIAQYAGNDPSIYPSVICYSFDESVNEITDCVLQIAGRIDGCDHNAISCRRIRLSPKDTDAFRALRRITRDTREPRFMCFALFARTRAHSVSDAIACYLWTILFLTIVISRAAVYRRGAFENLCQRPSLRDTSSWKER